MLEDNHGGWCRLRLKLGLSGLAVVNVVSPQTPFIQPHLLELAADLRAHGIDIPNIPSAPITYVRLLHQLSLLGLLPVQ